jgi:hypothetical protein
MRWFGYAEWKWNVDQRAMWERVLFDVVNAVRDVM